MIFKSETIAEAVLFGNVFVLSDLIGLKHPHYTGLAKNWLLTIKTSTHKEDRCDFACC